MADHKLHQGAKAAGSVTAAAEAAVPAALAPDTAPEAAVTDPNERVRIKIPTDRSKGTDLFVGVNSYTARIRRGEVVEIPRFAVEVLQRSLEQDENTERLIEALTAGGQQQ